MNQSTSQTKRPLEVIKRSKPDSRYITPDPEEIMEVLLKMGLPPTSDPPVPLSIVQDLCNMQSYEYFERDPKDALVDPIYWDKSIAPKELAYHKNIQDFLRNIDYNKYPGTPLERACEIALHLAAQNEANHGAGGGQGKQEENKDANGEEKMKCFQPGPNRDNSTELAKHLTELAEKLKHVTKFEEEVLGLNNLNTYQKYKKLSRGAEKMLMEISLKLEGFKKINVSTKKLKKVDPHSRKKRHIRIEDLNNVVKVPKVKFVDPAFDYKLATKALYHKEGFVIHEEKQILMMLIDDSGSMRTPQKLAWRNAILLNRCEAVAEGKAELILYFYENSRYERQHVKTPEEAKKLVKKVLAHSPGGGSTDIESALEASIKEIHAMHGYKPDIMIVLDGQDHFTDMDNKGVTVHAVIIGTEHKELEKFCRKTGGMFLYEKE